MLHLSSRYLGVLAAALVATGSAGVVAQVAREPAKPSPTLPGGASQMQETHGDWRVTCSQPSGERVCTLSQQRADQSSRQVVLGIELKALTPDKAEGTLLLPFGLAVTKPVALQVDDGGPTLTRTFRTCVPFGCLVDIALDAPAVKAFRAGTAVHVKAIADGGKDVSFDLPLNGFGSALDRTAALSK